MPEPVWRPNVTVAAVIENDGRYLLVSEKVDNRIVFNQPAGHLDEGESLIEAVVRETLEETRYRFTPQGLVGVYRLVADDNPDITYLRFCFCGTVGESLGGSLDQDIIDARWMTIEEIISCQSRHRSPLVLQCINDYLENPPCSLEIISRSFA